jgi:ribosomal protein S18 acetylase RimI-like enzyme
MERLHRSGERAMACEGEIQLRHATDKDARSIAEVHVRSWRQAYRGQLPQTFLDSLSVSDRAESWERRLVTAPGADRPFWVAEVGGTVVGFVNTGPSRDDDAQPGTSEIYAIYVHPECWEKGIGTRLLDRAVNDLRRHGYSSATLWCLGSNAQARAFYERARWRADGATKRELVGGIETEEVRYRLPFAA